MFKKVQFKLGIILFLLLFSKTEILLAKSDSASTPHYSSSEPDFEPKNARVEIIDESDRWIFKAHQKIADFFDNTADALDRWLVRKELTTKRNGTQVIIDSSIAFPEGAPAYTTTDLNVNLRLPNFEKYWQLKFTNYDEQQATRGARRQTLKQGRSGNEPKNYGASVGLFRDFDRVKVSFQPRINITSGLSVSQSLAVETQVKKTRFDFKPKLEFFATPEKATGVFLGLNTSFILSDIYSLSLVNEAEYQERDNIFIATQGPSLNQRLNRVSSLSYNLFFISDSRPSYHLESLNTSIGYSWTVYEQFIVVSSSVGLDFQKTNGFKGLANSTLGFSLIF